MYHSKPLPFILSGLTLSFVKDFSVVGGKMAKNGRKMAIYES
jgi:hypothetical protein